MSGYHICIVARRGKKYRILALWFHPLLNNFDTVDRCVRLLRIFADPFNRIALEQELIYSAIESKATDENGQSTSGCNAREFPFISTCLYIGMMWEAPFGDGARQGGLETATDNRNLSIQDELTVIDITDLDRLRYCIVFLGRVNIIPMSAVDYLKKTFHNDKENLKLQQELNFLGGFELVSMDTLRECWPKDMGHQMNSDLSRSQMEPPPTSVPFKSLLEMSMVKFLDELLESGDDAEVSLLDQPLQTSSMRDALLAYCRQNPDKLSRSSCSLVSIRLLASLWKEERFVDFSPYSEMMPDVVRSILRTLKHVRVLNLSGTLAASKDELARTLAEVDHDLDQLYILDRPDREGDDDPLPAIRAIGEQSWRVGKIVLTSVLSRSINQKPWMVSDEDILQETRNGFPSVSSSAELYGLAKSFPVIQIIHASKYNESIKSGQSFYLGDSLLSPVRAVSGFLKAIRARLVKRQIERYNFLISHGFALADSSLKAGDGIEVNAFPAEAYWFASRYWTGNVIRDEDVYGRVRDLTPDTWTILLQDSLDSEPNGRSKQIRRNSPLKVAMLRSKRPIQALQGQQISPEDVEVMDFEAFLARTAPGHEADLKEALKEIKAPIEQPMIPLGTIEAVEIMQHMFSNVDMHEDMRQEGFDWFS